MLPEEGHDISPLKGLVYEKALAAKMTKVWSVGLFTIGHCFVIIFKVCYVHTREKVGKSHPFWKGKLVPEFVESASKVRAVKSDEERLVAGI